jgi:FkbM family methyltransferase
MNYKTIEKFPYLNTLVKVQLDRVVGRKRVKTIIDIGAYDGSYCLYMSRCYPKAKVYAIEPAHKAFKILKRNTIKRPNINIFRLLISDAEGKNFIFTEAGQNRAFQGSSVFYDFVSKKVNTNTKEYVKSTTLHTFCCNNNIGDIDLMIMNCEGGEYKIFEDESSLPIIRRVKILKLALHGKSKLFLSDEYTQKKKNINHFLEDSGFSLVYGENLNSLAKLPKKHIQQIWIRA